MSHSPFPGHSEMARRMRALDWSQTPLGPVDQWPQALRTSVSTCLDCAFPIVLWWGPQLSILYNDEYIPMLGPAKHPSALGRPGAEVWAEIWDVIDPMLSQVMRTGEPTRSRDLLLHIDRGYPEEAYFSFSYSPIHGEDGTVAGVFCPVIETTDTVIGARRLRTLRDLAARTKGSQHREDAAYDAAAATLAHNAHDVPFALIYRVNHAEGVAERVATAGIAPRTPASPDRIALDGAGDPWAFAEVAGFGRTVVLTDLRARFEQLPSGAWRPSPHTALVQPVLLPGQDRPDAILITAASPMRALDAGYRTFFELVATQMAASLADARALDEERRRAEALAELDRAKTTFFSNVSHEFRTPLTLMLGPIEELLREAPGSLPHGAVSALAIAHRNSLRLLKLVNTLLDFSRIEAGRIDASFEPTDLAVLTTELASAFVSAADKAGLALVVDCAPPPEPVYVDRDMWEKIVLNLLSNALKFTRQGEIRVTLAWRDDHAALQVADTGIGIPEADLPRMFDRFHRAKHGGARTHEGTGIGLALVRELAGVHGGTATVESREGQGSVFTVTVPGGRAHLPAERIAVGPRLTPTAVGAMPFVEEALRWLPASEPGNVPPPTGAARPRVIVADDNADMRDYLTRLLAPLYQVETAADGQAAFERIRTAPPDLVLSDVMMPTLDGFGLVAAIRQDPATRSVPIILLSARAGEGAQIEGLGSGADQYLVKPFSARELLARVASQIELARLRNDAEQALRNRIDQFETLFRQAPIGVYLVDADFTIREVNPVALPVFGDIPGGVVGRDAGEVLRLLWNREYADEIVAVFRRTLATGEPYVSTERAEYRLDRGTLEYYDWRVDRLALPDGRQGLVCYFRDVSSQVRARLTIAESERQLREADARKDEFLALLAHELRNPLAPIRTGLELIRLSGDAPDTVRRVRTMIERQVTLMVRLIDDLLDVSRITSGKIVLQRRPSALGELVQSAVEAQRSAIEAAQVTLTIAPAAEPCVVDVDPARFVQIVSNILHNASKFTPPGGRITLAVEIERNRPEPCAAIRIADTGIGIPAPLLGRIFELFTQGDDPSERAQGGLGIGLALARRLTEMHGGEIQAASAGPGRGSEFTVRFPLSKAAAQEDRPPVVATPRVRSRALIIDDNRDAAATMSMFVEELGGTALAVHDGASGLTAIEPFRPDIVFMDIGMPGLDGYEVCRRIREMPSQRHVVLVAVTGWGQAQDKRRAFEVGFDAHLTKPVDPDAVAQLLAGAAVQT
jgi:PAS domain S-box-containing protein